MRQHRRWHQRTLPLRVWLIMAVAAVTGAGFLAQLGLTTAASVWEQQRADARLASVRSIIGTQPLKWSDSAWQQQATMSLSALGVDVALFPMQAPSSMQLGQPVYMTAGASRFLTSGGHSTTEATGSQLPFEAPSNLSVRVAFQRIVIASPKPTGNHLPVGAAFLWYSQPGPGDALGLLWPAVELGTFALTLLQFASGITCGRACSCEPYALLSQVDLHGCALPAGP